MLAEYLTILRKLNSPSPVSFTDAKGRWAQVERENINPGGVCSMFKLNDKGNVAIIVALCLPVVVGGAAFGIETGFWRYDQVRVQQAADAAAYAGAVVDRMEGS